MSFLTEVKDWLTNKKPDSKELSKAVEQIHITEFLYLVDATNFFINLLKIFPEEKRTPEQTKVIKDYLLKGSAIAKKWEAKQLELEKKGIPVFRPVFFSPKTQAAINETANKIKAGATKLSGAADGGRGLFKFVIAAVWPTGVVFSDKIADTFLKTTADELQQLQESTLKTAKELNMTPEQAQALLEKNLKEYHEEKNRPGVIEKALDKGTTIIFLALAGLAIWKFAPSNNK